MPLEEGDIVLLSLPQADGARKNRPVLLLRKFSPFNDFLVCGISSQIKQEVKDFDYVIGSDNRWFSETGLLQPSLIRLGFLAMVPSLLGGVAGERAQEIGPFPQPTGVLLGEERKQAGFVRRPRG